MHASLQRFVLSAGGWEIELLEAGAEDAERVSLGRFRNCTPTGAKARLLPQYESQPQADREALATLYQINRYGFPLWAHESPDHDQPES